jgi:hypothetical protein
MNVTKYLLEDIQSTSMVWTCSKNGRRKIVKEVMKWCPPGRRKRGRPKLTWAEGIRGLMGEKGLMEDWNDRGNWRKKIL